jgi:hypothetical protein
MFFPHALPRAKALDRGIAWGNVKGKTNIACLDARFGLDDEWIAKLSRTLFAGDGANMP